MQAIRDTIQPGQSKQLTSKGINFGVLARVPDGKWDTSKVEGISALILKSKGAGDPPTLVIRPFHQAGNVISLREFTNSAFNHHHGMQSEERFGKGTDPDGDGFSNELTRADITAVTIFQATLLVLGQVIPDDPEFREAISMDENRFKQVGCARCHVPALPLDNKGWIYTEPSPYNYASPVPNLRLGDAPLLAVDLTSDELPQPRLKPKNGVVWVPAFIDLKLHDITAGPNDPNREPLDMNQKAGSDMFMRVIDSTVGVWASGTCRVCSFVRGTVSSPATENSLPGSYGHRQPALLRASRPLHHHQGGGFCSFGRGAQQQCCFSGDECL